MILIEATMKWKGYDPRELSKGSHKRVCCVCDGCGRVRWQELNNYKDLCNTCSHRTPEYLKLRSVLSSGQKPSIETIRKQTRWYTQLSDEGKREVNRKKSDRYKNLTDEEKYEIRRKRSATHQGIPYEEWDGFVKNGAYCEKFDDACRERIRAEYNHRCYICDKTQDENIDKNGMQIKLAVHHVDRNKDQGCNGVQWKLIPLCMHCHPGSHRDPIKSRLEYLLNMEYM